MAEPDWESIRHFLAIARHGSLSAASRQLDLSAPTLGRRIDALEDALGLKLLRRGPDGVRVTRAGEAILRVARPGERHLAEIDRVARTLREGTVPARVRIASTEPIVSDVLAPHLASLRERLPDLTVELESGTAASDLRVGPVDIAIRLARPREDHLVVKRLPAAALALFCSEAYLDGRTPAALVPDEERLLWFDDSYGDIPELRWARERGLEPAFVLRSNSTRTLLEAARAGAGIAPLPRFMGDAAALVRLPHEGPPARVPWLVFHRDTRGDPTFRTVRRWIEDCCERTFAG